MLDCFNELYKKNALFLRGVMDEEKFVRTVKNIIGIAKRGQELKVFLSLESISPVHATALYDIVKNLEINTSIYVLGNVNNYSLFFMLAFKNRYVFNTTRAMLPEFKYIELQDSLSNLRVYKIFFEKIKNNLLNIIRNTSEVLLEKDILEKEITLNIEDIQKYNICTQKLEGGLKNE